MTFSFGSQDSSRSRRPQCVGTIRQKISGSEPHLTKKLYANEELIFGRDQRRCQVILDDPHISNKHLRIYSIIFDQDQADEIPPLVYAEDLSRNGTFWNGTLMGVGNGGFLLSRGDVLKLSKDIEVEFNCDDNQIGEPLDSDQRDTADVTFNNTYSISDRKIGSGGFGQVYMAINNFNHRQVACKIVPLKKIKEKYGACEAAKYKFGRFERPSPAKKVNHKREMLKVLSWKKRTALATRLAEKLKTYDREVDILKSQDHPNIIRLEKVFKTDDYIFMFQELVTGGDLFSFLEYKNGKLLDTEAAVIIRQILKAVDYLHDRGIVHRDLKPDNILMTSLANGSRVVLTDFGGARMIDKDMKRMTTAVGTKEFIAPEVLGKNKALRDKQGYTKAVDMWSLGCVTVVLLTGGSIFRDPHTQEYSEALASECNLDLLNNDPEWGYVGERPKDFVRGLMVLDEDKRMTAKQALEHSWFTNPLNKQNFEDVYQRAIKTWKPKMVIGTVVEDLDLSSEANKALLRSPSKRFRAKPGVPIDPPYKPAPKNFTNYFYAKKKTYKSVEDYIESSSASSESSNLNPPSRNTSSPTPRIAGDVPPSSQASSRACFFTAPTLTRPKSADLPPPRWLMKKLPLKPLVVAKETNCDTPLQGIEDTDLSLGSTDTPPNTSILRESPFKENARWPFSPGAWNKEPTPSRTISWELTPLRSKLREPPAKRQKFEPLKPLTPSPLESPTFPSESSIIARPDPQKDGPKARLAQSRTPTAMMKTLTLKRVPSLGRLRNEANMKRKRSDSVFDVDDEGEETQVEDSKRRKREVSIFDFPEDDEDDEVEETLSVSPGWQSALAYGKQSMSKEKSGEADGGTAELDIEDGDDSPVENNRDKIDKMDVQRDEMKVDDIDSENDEDRDSDKENAEVEEDDTHVSESDFESDRECWDPEIMSWEMEEALFELDEKHEKGLLSSEEYREESNRIQIEEEERKDRRMKTHEEEEEEEETRIVREYRRKEKKERREMRDKGIIDAGEDSGTDSDFDPVLDSEVRSEEMEHAFYVLDEGYEAGKFSKEQYGEEMDRIQIEEEDRQRKREHEWEEKNKRILKVHRRKENARKEKEVWETEREREKSAEVEALIEGLTEWENAREREREKNEDVEGLVEEQKAWGWGTVP